MARKKGRRAIETMSLSFLDATCCGLGAIILLLVITKLLQPMHIEQHRERLGQQLVLHKQQLKDILANTQQVIDQRDQLETQLTSQQAKINNLEAELARIKAALSHNKDDAEISSELAGRLATAKEHLSAEMQKLLANYKPPLDQYKVAGIPIDSEYIIFVIDNSGSMLNYQWDRVMKKMTEALDVYPHVKGMQVMNCDGAYLFPSYRKEWIPDSPARRKLIIKALQNWHAYCNSSPRNGLLRAIDDFYDPKKEISIYYFGDDFSLGSGAINATVREIDRANHANDADGRRVRIHAVAFPTYYEVTGGKLLTAADFAVLMRAVCARNGGTFITLPARRVR